MKHGRLPGLAQVLRRRLRGKAGTLWRATSDLGLNRSQTGAWVQGRVEPSLRQMITLADYLGCSVQDLIDEAISERRKACRRNT